MPPSRFRELTSRSLAFGDDGRMTYTIHELAEMIDLAGAHVRARTAEWHYASPDAPIPWAG